MGIIMIVISYHDNNNNNWLVVQFHHLEKWWSSSMGRMTSHLKKKGKIKFMFQTTNQILMIFLK